MQPLWGGGGVFTKSRSHLVAAIAPRPRAPPIVAMASYPPAPSRGGIRFVGLHTRGGPPPLRLRHNEKPASLPGHIKTFQQLTWEPGGLSDPRPLARIRRPDLSARGRESRFRHYQSLRKGRAGSMSP